jgi:hypothetical protein
VFADLQPRPFHTIPGTSWCWNSIATRPRRWVRVRDPTVPSGASSRCSANCKWWSRGCWRIEDWAKWPAALRMAIVSVLITVSVSAFCWWTKLIQRTRWMKDHGSLLYFHFCSCYFVVPRPRPVKEAVLYTKQIDARPRPLSSILSPRCLITQFPKAWWQVQLDGSHFLDNEKIINPALAFVDATTIWFWYP